MYSDPIVDIQYNEHHQNGGVHVGTESEPQHSDGQATVQILDDSFNPTEGDDSYEHSEAENEEVALSVPMPGVPEQVKSESPQIDGLAATQILDSNVNITKENERFVHFKVEIEEADPIVPHNGNQRVESDFVKVDGAIPASLSRFQLWVENV